MGWDYARDTDIHGDTSGMIVIAAIVITTALIYFCANHLSLVFRHSYLRQKLMNRVTPEEKTQIDKTDLDFWSFLK